MNSQIAISGLGLWNPQFVPPPSDILDSFSRLAQRDLLIKDIIFSLSNFIVGYFLAVVVGVLVGLGLGMLRTFRTMAGPLVWISYATPRSAIAPLLIMWLGFGQESKVAIIFLFAVYPIIINVWQGLQEIERTDTAPGL